MGTCPVSKSCLLLPKHLFWNDGLGLFVVRKYGKGEYVAWYYGDLIYSFLSGNL